MINRIVLFVSLVGVVLSLHLWVQQERGFDRGCWGLGRPPDSAATEACRAVAAAPPQILGSIPVVTAGYLFYSALALLAVCKIVFSPVWAHRCHHAGSIATLGAFGFSGYLLYWQGFVLQAFCPLCLVSSGVVTALLALQVMEMMRGGFRPTPEENRFAELSRAGLIIAVGVTGAIGVLFFVDRIGVRRLNDGTDAREFDAMLGRALPRYIDPSLLKEIAACRVDVSSARLRVPEWINAATPAWKPRAGAPVVFFLDPNCPHCPQAYAMARRLDERFEERAGCYILPLVLWDHSLLQVQALEVARREGKYFEMWQAQLDARKPEGLNLEDIARLCTQIGLSPDGLAERLDAVRDVVIDSRRRAQRAGIRMSPSIYVNGGLVASANMTESCVAQLVERNAQARLQAGAPTGVQLRRGGDPVPPKTAEHRN